MKAFNDAMLAHQGWWLICNPQSLVARLLRAIYFPGHNFLASKVGVCA